MSLAVAETAQNAPAYLEVENLSKVYATEDGPIRALDRVSLRQERGEFVSIVGPSGCGKSTLVMHAAGLACIRTAFGFVMDADAVMKLDSLKAGRSAA